MNKNIVYLKEANEYTDVLKKENTKIPLLFKKLIFSYKYIFNIITKKEIENNNVWILPVKEKYKNNKLKKILKNISGYKENIYLISNELKNNSLQELMDEFNLKYITEEKTKKILSINILKYIANLQQKDISELEITILVNNTSDLNMYLIEEIAKKVKSLKIVSLNIYKFKKIEEKLYNEYGIAIQFSNSYKKSLEKANIVINLDFDELKINEYEIFEKAIIINCINENIKIKSRLFNGIVINSFDIEFDKEIINKFKQMNLYENYKKLLIYASIIEKEENILKIFEKIEADNINITNLIGNNGNINKKEFKIINKKLDKKQKTE